MIIGVADDYRNILNGNNNDKCGGFCSCGGMW